MTSRPAESNGRDGLPPPTAARRLLAGAGQSLRSGQTQAAERALLEALRLAPECAEANRLMGIVQQMRGDPAQAATFLRRALAQCPDDPTLHTGLGIALHQCGAVEEALACLERACDLAPRLASSWFNLGKALKSQSQHFERARDVLLRALEIDPAHVAARLILGDTQTALGEITAAVENYREILRRQPHDSAAWLALSNVKTAPFSASDVSRLRRALQHNGSSLDARIALGFTLSRALEDQADYPAAFQALREANALKRGRIQWNPVSEHSRVEAIAAAFAEPRTAAPDPTQGQEIIFVVSLPRSGSTLTEQILASHRDVEGANELQDLRQVIEAESARRGQAFPRWVGSASASDWARLGEDYLARTAWLRQRRPRSTDKNLLNWQLVGAAMAMLPGARVVNSRRDPLETCLACYRQLFVSGNHFSYELGEMADYWHDYDRLCRHWARLFPQRFLDQTHESLLAEPERCIRRLLDFCGLDFDPDCLRFHRTRRVVRTASAAQVRQPLLRDTARARLYGGLLDTLRAKLAALS